jgi:Protein of unknown function (DUF2924)
MTPARANSGRAAKLPTAPTPGASLPLDASVLSIVANLEGLDLNGLRRQWRAHLGGEAPTHFSRWLLMKVLAYRLQSDAFGDLDKSIRRILRSGKDDGVGAALSCLDVRPLIKGYFSALRWSRVRSCLRPSFAENRIRWP